MIELIFIGVIIGLKCLGPLGLVQSKARSVIATCHVVGAHCSSM